MFPYDDDTMDSPFEDIETVLRKTTIFPNFASLVLTFVFLLARDDLGFKTILTGGLLDMMTSSNGNIFRVTGPLCGEFTDPGEFPAQRPVTRSFDVFFDLRLAKRLCKQSWGWWLEMLSRAHYDATLMGDVPG